jgi:hypothetical protein
MMPFQCLYFSIVSFASLASQSSQQYRSLSVPKFSRRLSSRGG